MNGEQNAMSFGELDGPTTKFLARLAKDASYLDRDDQTAPTDERLYKEGIEAYKVGQLEINGKVVTIHSFDANRLFNTLQRQQKSNSSSNDKAEQSFAVDWPIEQENGRSYLSFYFKDRPSREDITKTHQIFQIKIAIENNELPQMFLCEHCSERVHWTNLTNDSTMTLEERIVLARKRLCNCEDSLDLLREGMDEDQPITAEYGPAMNKESVASSTD